MGAVFVLSDLLYLFLLGKLSVIFLPFLLPCSSMVELIYSFTHYFIINILNIFHMKDPVLDAEVQ